MKISNKFKKSHIMLQKNKIIKINQTKYFNNYKI